MIGAAAAGLGASLGVLGGERANQANAKEAKRNRRWQEAMSNSAHQREVKDLRKAGLNPILSAKLGGASTPPGAQAVMQNSAQNVSSDISKTSLLKAQAKNLAADTDLKGASADAQDFQALKLAEDAKLLREQQKLTINSAKSIAQDIDIKQHEVNLQNALGTNPKYIQQLIQLMRTKK